ncbi:unnamed protein product, partial [Brenthis ino]
MDEYPDPDEEYELMYSDDLELLREMDEHTGSNENKIKKKSFQSKRSLDFTSPPSTNKSTTSEISHSKDNSVHNGDTTISLTPSLQQLDDVLTPNVSNKRTAEDLFGDINDIDFDNIELPSKRQKTEEESDMDLINKIIEGRKIRQMLAEPSGRGFKETKPNYNIKENVTMNVPMWPFIPITNWDGERVYVRLLTEDAWEEVLDTTTEKLTLRTTFASVWEEARKILEKKQQQKESTESIQEVTTNVMSELWVEKYRPKSYVDLLSEEPVNRALLHWLHLWDKIVFKKEVKTTEPQQRNTFSKRTGQFQLSNKWKGKKENEPEVDEDGRPHHKVALLCGPPGVGKTTLAHLLARLAGYRPVEINASDERSTEAFQNALQSATLMRSVLDSEKRPNCLILDEIDGAPIQTVELLVKWCTATAHKKEEGKKGKGKSQPLRRPVIAICNDLYATSLRPLRPVSLTVSVGCVSASRLLARLRAVARGERVRAAPRALALLAARAAGDVRAALHALSFVKAMGTQITVEEIEKISIGTKDHTKSVMQALQAIFTINDTDPNAIMKTVQAAGEYDRLVDGIFENYLSARVDARLLIACETTSWLRFYDTVHSWILRNQNYSLYSLLPLCIVRCHTVLASRQGLKVRFPMQAQEMSRKKAELDSILWSVCRGAAVGRGAGAGALRLDVLPLLPYLLAPRLRSANVQVLLFFNFVCTCAKMPLCSDSEKRALRACAGAMCDYGLAYSQQRGADGLYAYVLEPDIYKIAFFGSEERIKPPPAIRQAIAREQQLEIIRRNESMMNRTTNNNQENKVKADIQAKHMKNSEERLPNHLQRLQPKTPIRTTPQVQKDFFGRIVPVAQTHKNDAVSDAISSSSVFYQYREGFNNAVRRNVRLRDLL